MYGASLVFAALHSCTQDRLWFLGMGESAGLRLPFNSCGLWMSQWEAFCATDMFRRHR